MKWRGALFRRLFLADFSAAFWTVVSGVVSVLALLVSVYSMTRGAEPSASKAELDRSRREVASLDARVRELEAQMSPHPTPSPMSTASAPARTPRPSPPAPPAKPCMSRTRSPDCTIKIHGGRQDFAPGSISVFRGAVLWFRNASGTVCALHHREAMEFAVWKTKPDAVIVPHGPAFKMGFPDTSSLGPFHFWCDANPGAVKHPKMLITVN
ncbi:hypothetical protein AB0B89_08600 [Sphaerisporangium sp. NPDC049002]|uniref:hypothetical protein n=1 Tax=unclassified Sphaerisporangium TaxID=2630420 RepID=UPI0033C54EA7